MDVSLADLQQRVVSLVLHELVVGTDVGELVIMHRGTEATELSERLALILPQRAVLAEVASEVLLHGAGRGFPALDAFIWKG